MSHAMGAMRELFLGRVIATDDPEQRGRVEVEVVATGLTMWASCITNGAGAGYGVACLPKTDEIVVLAFIGPDEGNAFILGSVWTGDSGHPEDGRPVEDIYAITTPAGCKLLINDSDGPKVDIETPSGAHMTITDNGGGEITLERGGETVSMTESTITISSSSTVSIDTTTASISASMVQVDASFSQFSGVVQCDTLIATSAVVSPSYTPGAGNIW